MSKKSISFILLFLFCSTLSIIAQEAPQKSELHKQAESIDIKKDAAQARSLYLRAFSDYSNKGDAAQAVECAVKATQLYYRVFCMPVPQNFQIGSMTIPVQNQKIHQQHITDILSPSLTKTKIQRGFLLLFFHLIISIQCDLALAVLSVVF